MLRIANLAVTLDIKKYALQIRGSLIKKFEKEAIKNLVILYLNFFQFKISSN